MDQQSQANTATTIPPLAVRALMRGQKIAAIKIVREERGIELIEAKEVVEAYIASDPVIQAEMKNARRNGSGLGWIVVVIIVGVFAWYFLAK